ncbi:MAG TPA: hypothetical protein VGO96_00690 [Pyrinomonadaceae bacterium]|nr:hypothetical protein [Pyrinomonadaceae bacterium]
MQRFVSFACLLTLFVAGSFNALAKGNGEAARALEILKQARVAIGGEEKIASVQSLTLKGKFRRVMQEREMAGEREFNFLLPDKFMKFDTLIVGGTSTSFTNYRALSGSESWSGGNGGNGGMMFISRDGSKPTKEQMEKVEREQAQRFRAEYARYLLALLLTQPSGYGMEFNYAGEAVADDGRADVIDATAPEGFAARIFLDKETHLPLMLTYRAPKPRVFTAMMRSDGDKKKQEDALKEAREKAAHDMATAKPEEVEMQLRFTDYRKVGGLLLPHRITQGSDGEVNEEWEIKTYELNPQFKADKFQKK